MVCREWSSKSPSDNADDPSEVKAAMSPTVATAVGPLVIDNLVIENHGLKSRVAQLSQKVLANAEELADERLRYVKEIEKLNRDNDDLRKSNDELRKSNDELKADIVHLKSIIADQQSKIDKQTVQMDKQTVQIDKQTVQIAKLTVQSDYLLKRVARLMRGQNLITAREAMRALEWFICVETVGAKTRVAKEKLFTIDAIERSELKRKLPTWVTPEVVVELRKSKHDGNTAIHDARFTRDDVEEAFADADPDREALKMMMLKMLDAYYKLHSLKFGAPLVSSAPPSPPGPPPSPT